MKKIKVLLVCGPWGCGSSAVAGFLSNGGIYSPGPFHVIPDPKTPHTYEMEAFWQTLIKVISPPTLKRTAPSAAIVKVLTEFRDNILIDTLQKERVPDDSTIMLKHPLASFVLPEMCEVFDVRIHGVLRPIKEIEATRARRQWPLHFGTKGAEVIYGHLFTHITNTSTPFLLTRYSDLLANPRRYFDSIADFAGIVPTDEQRKSACEFITNRA